jgi:Ulp1 family protease
MKNLTDSDPKKASRIHIFSSLFYKKLIEKPDKYDSYQLVKRWTKNVDIFEKDFLIIPINEDIHWSLVIIVRPGLLMNSSAIIYPQQAKTVFDLDPPTVISPENKQEEAVVDDTNFSCILFLDSLRMHDQTTISSQLRYYLTFEWVDKKKVLADGEKLPDSIIDPRSYIELLPFNNVKSFPSVDCGSSVRIHLNNNNNNSNIEKLKELINYLIFPDLSD